MLTPPLLLLGALSAGTVDLVLGPPVQAAPLGATVDVTLTASTSGPGPEGITAIDAILGWDPAQLEFLGADASGYPWFVAGFLPNTNGINDDLTDGEALFTMLASLTAPASVPPDLEAVIFRFKVLGSGAVSLTPTSSGSQTRVLGLGVNNNVTGAISATASVVAPALSYCTAGTSASGCNASLSATGLASASAASGFTVTASALEGAKSGTFFFGSNGRQANPWGNGTSLQCVVPPVKRVELQTATGSAGQCDGVMARDLNALWCASCPKPAKNPGAGALVQIQLWYRDPLSTSNQTTSMSDALEFTVAP